MRYADPFLVQALQANARSRADLEQQKKRLHQIGVATRGVRGQIRRTRALLEQIDSALLRFDAERSVASAALEPAAGRAALQDVSTQTEDYRRKAEEAEQKADEASDLEARRLWRQTAEQWRELAQGAKRDR